jgi:translation initiation factor IF-1
MGSRFREVRISIKPGRPEDAIAMGKKETILLDARLLSVIDKHAFDAELPNGHRFVAFISREDPGCEVPQPGARVTVEMSPYDMGKGRLVDNQEQRDESTSFSKKNV